VTEYPVPDGSQPHDVAPGRDGTVWYTAQAAGKLGRLDPATGKVTEIPLGEGSVPHGVIVGPDGGAWVTDGGRNAIVRVDPVTLEVKRYPLPTSSGYTNLNTATFDRRGRLWFTGQSGIYGRLDPHTGALRVFRAPGGAGPYGIATTPGGQVWYASLAGSHIARIDVPGRRRLSGRPHAGRVRGASGRTHAGGCGSASGMPARSLAMTRRRAVGANGAYRAPLSPTPSTSTIATWSG
jgi:virginiamycin B lyase